MLLFLQQLTNNTISANFNNNVQVAEIAKIPMSDGKSEKFELFEDLFQTSLEFHNQSTEDDKINNFHCLLRGDSQILNIQGYLLAFDEY